MKIFVLLTLIFVHIPVNLVVQGCTCYHQYLHVLYMYGIQMLEQIL